MNIAKNTLLAAIAFTAAATASADIAVSGVTARQRWPWNNLVDIDFTLSGTEAGAFYQVDVAARFPGIEGDEVAAKSLVTEPIVSGDGTHRVTWDLAADHPGLVTSNFTARVTVTPLGDTAPVYMVIDLSAGPSAGAGEYPVRYTTRAPDLSDDTCRTTEMWLRRCPAGTFSMGYDGYMSAPNSAWAPHNVTHSWPFYIGIFECTQQQWYQVQGNWPSFYSNETYRASRPVEQVSFQNIRGETGWQDNDPASGANCAAGTFIANLRARTGLAWIDLPTEAQWEYAARAGTDYEYGWADAEESNIKTFARGANTPSPKDGTTVNVANRDVTTDYGTAKVGSYRANAWGLYDMLGNVYELCGDAKARDRPTADGTKKNGSAYAASDWIDPRMDPYDPTTISGGRIIRGGAMSYANNRLTVYNRLASGADSASRSIGFRVAVTVK